MWYLTSIKASVWASYLSSFISIFTNCGHYYGRVLKIEQQSPVVEFLGIPYAKPPIKNLRFEDPQLPHCNMRDKYVFDEYAKSCPQLKAHGSNKREDPHFVNVRDTSEDCLYLNIWKPIKGTSLPVLVFFHGGDFMSGSANLDMYNASYLAYKTQSIVVTVNYRLNVFGFSQSLFGSKIKGNMGLKDQQMALRWINTNIFSFGGSKNKVTIFGIGSGAASVSAHLFAEDSFSYYSRAIMFSGHLANVKHSKHYKVVQKYTEDLIKNLGCKKRKHKHHDEMKCLKGKNAYKIMEEAGKIYHGAKNYEFGSPFAISLYDRNFFKKNLTGRFIGPYRNITDLNSNVKVLLGHTKDEGALDLLKEHHQSDIVYNKTTRKYNVRITNERYKKIVQEIVRKLHLSKRYEETIKEEYNNITKNKEKVIKMFSELYTDCNLKEYVYIKLALLNKSSHVFMLKRPSKVRTKESFPWLGVTSMETIEYIFGNPFRHPEQYNSHQVNYERGFSLKMMQVIGNFTYNKPFDQKWTTSNLTVFKERLGYDIDSLDSYVISLSKLNTNSCHLFERLIKYDIKY